MNNKIRGSPKTKTQTPKRIYYNRIVNLHYKLKHGIITKLEHIVLFAEAKVEYFKTQQVQEGTNK